MKVLIIYKVRRKQLQTLRTVGAFFLMILLCCI